MAELKPCPLCGDGLDDIGYRTMLFCASGGGKISVRRDVRLSGLPVLEFWAQIGNSEMSGLAMIPIKYCPICGEKMDLEVMNTEKLQES